MEYKEVWQEEYDAAVDRGELDPGRSADEKTSERFAHLADLARDLYKHGELDK